MLTGTGHNTEIPETFRKYFWDVSFEDLSLVKNRTFITERLLNYGDLESVRWLKATVGVDFIRSVVIKSRNLNPKTLNYWQLMLNIPAKNSR
jgi:hypothetical protein